MAETPNGADLKVFYDGDCPLCRREIALYRDLRGADSINWVNVANCDGAEIPANTSREQLLGRFHIQAPDQSLQSGAAAFVEIWRQLPAFRFLARLAEVPGALPVLEFGYNQFLKIRPFMQKAARKATNDQPAHSDNSAR